MLPSYPTELDEGRKILANMGSFWSETYGDLNVLESHFQNRLRLVKQEQLDYLETVAVLSRYKVPVFSRKLWHTLTLYRGQMNSSITTPLRYDSTASYDGHYAYGEALGTVRSRFPLPDDKKLIGCAHVTDHVVNPGIALTSGVDFRIDGNVIEFLKNPFDGQFVTRSTVMDDGREDEAIDLWLLAADYDLGLIYEQFGYALGLYAAESSESYRELINAFWNSLSQGPTAMQLRKGIAAACRIPFIQSKQETVEAVYTHPLRTQVITDQRVYDLPAGSTASVKAKQRVFEGDFLCNAVSVIELNQATDAELNRLDGFSLSTGTCALALGGPLNFRNSTVTETDVLLQQGFPVTYSKTNGIALARFTGIDGATADVNTFWTNADQFALNNPDNSIAQMLRRVPGTAQPDQSELVDRVNPMKWLLRNVFGNGTFLVLIDPTRIGLQGAAVDLRFIRQILPAHALPIVIQKTGI